MWTIFGQNLCEDISNTTPPPPFIFQTDFSLHIFSHPPVLWFGQQDVHEASTTNGTSCRRRAQVRLVHHFASRGQQQYHEHLGHSAVGIEQILF